MPSPAPTLTTARLTLAPHAPADLDELLAMWAEPVVHRHIAGRAFTREEVWQRLLRYIGHWHALGWGNWAIRETASGRWVGDAGFMDARRAIEPPLPPIPEVGWVLAGWAHGQGFAREALAAILAWGDARRLGPSCCIIDPANAASIRLAGRVGYRPAGSAIYHGKAIGVFRREPPPAGG
jgi:RimJ/RimL family protein N-acetyltransferase